MQTSDLELAHAQRYQRASEGEAWAHYGWDAEGVKYLLQDRNYGLSIDEVNLAHQALSSLAADEGSKSGEGELYQEAHPNMLEWGSFSSVSQIGMGRFKKAWGRMKAWLQKQYVKVSANVAGLSSTGFAFKGKGFRHCWWAFDYDCCSGWALDYDHGSYAATSGSYKGRGCDRAPKVLPPKHIPVCQSMVAINLDAPTPVPGPTPESKADPQLPPRNFVMVVHPIRGHHSKECKGDRKKGGQKPSPAPRVFSAQGFAALFAGRVPPSLSFLSLKGLQILKLSGPKLLARDSQPSHSPEELSVGPQSVEDFRGLRRQSFSCPGCTAWHAFSPLRTEVGLCHAVFLE